MNKYLIFILFLYCACTKGDGTNTNAQVYVSGYEIRPADYPNYQCIPKYWVNGKAIYLADPSYINAMATGIAVVGNDIYVAADSSASHTPFYLKNGKPVAVNAGSILNDPDFKAAISSNNQFWKYATGLPKTLSGTTKFYNVAVYGVYVSGNDIYAVGTVNNISSYKGPVSGTSLAVYWKNGVLIPLEDSLNSTSPSSARVMDVVGKDVYVAGLSVNGGVYWKNGVRNSLSGTCYSIAAIKVDGNDVYVAGSGPSSQSNDTEVKYWKNGKLVELSDSPAFYQTRTSTGIDVVNNNVYVATCANNYLPNTTVFNIAKYWVNYTPYNLNNATSKFEYTTGIVVK
jgi:hypothetical protein